MTVSRAVAKMALQWKGRVACKGDMSALRLPDLEKKVLRQNSNGGGLKDKVMVCLAKGWTAQDSGVQGANVIAEFKLKSFKTATNQG